MPAVIVNSLYGSGVKPPVKMAQKPSSRYFSATA